jgi:hypothetical protein
LIPRYQRILFWGLLGGIVAMALVLLRGCEQARERLSRHRDETPLAAPTISPTETVTLLLAKDSDGSITPFEREIALPAEPTSRARALLTGLIVEYSGKDSTHPLESGPAVDDVFLLDLPLHPPKPVSPGLDAKTGPAANTGPIAGTQPSTVDSLYDLSSSGQLAIVNLRGAFADRHPSGIETESLTIQSILATLHANFPHIRQVRFLVDGQPRDTLNGHADLLRAYPVVDIPSRSAVLEGSQP